MRSRKEPSDPHHVPGAIPISEASQQLRDARAAMAVAQSPLDPYQALTDLHPEAGAMGREGRRRLRKTTIQRERVKAMLQNDLSDLEAHSKECFSRMVGIVLHEEPDLAIRAFAQLSKVAGCAAPIKLETTGKNSNLHTLLNDPAAVREALSMSHEPGASGRDHPMPKIITKSDLLP